ncbi:L,D-transpeptidase family protein [Ovoidimarina sediminis]|uniref:L,D-transpeptidase family protein n=1 Tax=Ovoidimarina sediminis TaxID=3079856 RepID=UPI0029111662|nr:L,D-transpeptidase family protein [Rhodophyticola sp. MJ-SS7]MDU8941867.1 L,D-transpeptidase family protein [Rhodophyticola sp. MJ-SS7]
MARSIFPRFFRRLLAPALFLILAACGGGGAPEPEPERAAGVAQDMPFQARLDALSLPLTLPEGRAILVNIPSFELIAFEDGVPVLRSRVIVGKPETRTPRMKTYTSAVIFWPSWRPTPEMVASGEVPDRVFPPGPDNPMGVLAIQLEPGLDVFMHDTNQRELFGQPTRAFSHGCIRVERWAALAAWLLERDEASVRAMSAGPVTRRAETGPVPVLIRYFTVFPSEGGGVGVYPDIYGLAGGGTAFGMSTKNRAGCAPPIPKP